MKSHETRIDLQSNAKAVSIDLLNSRLAYAIDLALVTKQAQWNLKGIQFHGPCRGANRALLPLSRTPPAPASTERKRRATRIRRTY
jgi:hypothetical protein